MKTKLPIVAVVAILVSACTTGTYMTKNYDDGIYFTPADQPPVTVASSEAAAPAQEKSAKVAAPEASDQGIVMSQMNKNTDGTSTVNNYIYQPDKDNQNSDVHAYNMDNQDLTDSDTTAYYNDDDVKYVINNYYDDNDNIDYAYRIGRFYRPFYNPFFYDDWYYGYYSPWYSGYYGSNWGIGWDPWYYGGWGYPYGYGYYSPYYFGLSGYWGYGYPYYGGYYGGGYYGGGGYWGGNYNNTYQVARRRPTNMNMAGGGIGGSASFSGRAASIKSGTTDPNRVSNTWVENGHVRSRTINGSSASQTTKAATIVNDRRSGTNPDGTRSSNIVGSQTQERQVTRTQQATRQGTEVSGNARRSYAPTTTSRTYTQQRAARESQNYTPSYSKPRIVNQSNFNNNSYSRPRTYNNTATQSMKSASTNRTQIYNAPRSSSSVRQTYRSSSSYSSGSSSSSYRGSSSSSTPNSSYSAPARSSSSYSSGSSGYSGGGSSSSGGGSRSSGGGGGGSGHRR